MTSDLFSHYHFSILLHLSKVYATIDTSPLPWHSLLFGGKPAVAFLLLCYLLAMPFPSTPQQAYCSLFPLEFLLPVSHRFWTPVPKYLSPTSHAPTSELSSLFTLIITLDKIKFFSFGYIRLPCVLGT